MATGWTDLTLFVAGDIVLPALFSGLPSAGKTNYQVEVKRDFERIIKDVWYGVGRQSQSTSDDFNIEQIQNGSVLKETALLWNNLWIARQNMTDIADPDDKYGSYYVNNKDWIEKQLQMDVKQLQFAEPSGINQLIPFVTEITR